MARLARRDHSVGELSRKMLRAGYGPEEVETVLEHLKSRRYLDDHAFARNFTRSASERRLWGPARIERRLKELDLDETTIAEALQESFPEGEEESLAERALARFLSHRGRSAGGLRAKARAYRHLLGRGFSPTVAHRLVSRRDFEDTGQ